MASINSEAVLTLVMTRAQIVGLMADERVGPLGKSVGCLLWAITETWQKGESKRIPWAQVADQITYPGGKHPTRRAVRDAMAELEEAGYVTVDRSNCHRSNPALVAMVRRRLNDPLLRADAGSDFRVWTKDQEAEYEALLDRLSGQVEPDGEALAESSPDVHGESRESLAPGQKGVSGKGASQSPPYGLKGGSEKPPYPEKGVSTAPPYGEKGVSGRPPIKETFSYKETSGPSLTSCKQTLPPLAHAFGGAGAGERSDRRTDVASRLVQAGPSGLLRKDSQDGQGARFQTDPGENVPGLATSYQVIGTTAVQDGAQQGLGGAPGWEEVSTPAGMLQMLWEALSESARGDLTPGKRREVLSGLEAVLGRHSPQAVAWGLGVWVGDRRMANANLLAEIVGRHCATWSQYQDDLADVSPIQALAAGHALGLGYRSARLDKQAL